MVYKFRSLKEPDLKLLIKDVDGDEVTVQFESINGPRGGKIGLFETEETKIAEAMIADERNGVIYMDANYVKKKEPKGKVETPTESAPKTQTISEKPKRKSKKKKVYNM